MFNFVVNDYLNPVLLESLLGKSKSTNVYMFWNACMFVKNLSFKSIRSYNQLIAVEESMIGNI